KHDAIVVIDSHGGRSPARKAVGILCPFRAEPCDSKDNEILRRTVVMARDGETPFIRAVGNRCAVAFVADQSMFGSESVTVAKPSALETPMIGMLHCIAEGFALAPPLPSAIAMADAGQAVFRIKPEPLIPPVIIAVMLGLVANESRIPHEVNPPPAGVAAE